MDKYIYNDAKGARVQGPGARSWVREPCFQLNPEGLGFQGLGLHQNINTNGSKVVGQWSGVERNVWCV